MAGCIKMALGTEVGLGPGHIVLDGDPVPHPKRGWSPSPIFGPFLLWPNSWMHEDATSPPPKNPQFLAASIKMPLGTEVGFSPDGIVLDGDPAPLPKKGAEPHPHFRPMSIVAKLLDGSR